MAETADTAASATAETPLTTAPPPAFVTSTVVFTTAYLGSPDWGAVFCGYVGSFLLAGAATAIGVFASALSRS